MDAGGLKVATPGSTLVVQVDGVMGNPLKNKAAAYPNTFTNGTVVPDTAGGLIKNPMRMMGRASNVERALSVNEKVYLLKAELNPDNVALTVQSCGDCDPKAIDPAHQPFRAKVTFKFLKGALASTDFKHVQQTIDQVFKFPDAAADTAAAPAAPPPAQPNTPAPPPPAPEQQQAPPPPPEQQQQFAPIAAPPPPPAEPRKIKLGMTLQEVKDSFGEPASIVDLDSKVIYMYKQYKVTFVNGKVSDVDVL